MKQLLLLTIGLFYGAIAYGKCASDGLWVSPGGKEIKQNSIFILEGYGGSQEVVKGLNTKYAVYLKSGKTKVRLIVRETFAGQFRLTQAILKPEKDLDAGLEYTFCIDDLPPGEEIGKYNPESGESEAITFKVIAEKDIEKPQLSSKPVEIRKDYKSYGCGPAIHVVFSNPAKDDSDIFVKTTVKNLQTGTETTYCLELKDNEIRIGHGMCSGGFYLEDGEKFEVEFSFMDASGNTAGWEGERISFIAPTLGKSSSE